MTFRRRLARRLYLFTMHREGMWWIKIRGLLADQILGRKHKRLWIGPNVDMGSWTNLALGDHVSINRNCVIAPHGGLTIGDYVSIAPGCMVMTFNHGSKGKGPIKYQPQIPAAIVIEDDVWIGANCTILPSVILPEGTIVGANALVAKSPDKPYSTIGGVPAKTIKVRR